MNKEELAACLSRIECFKVTDAFKLFECLEAVQSSLDMEKKDLQDSKYTKLKILVVDSLGILISPLLLGGAPGNTNNLYSNSFSSSNFGQYLMISISRILKVLAMKHNVAVVVCSSLPFIKLVHKLCYLCKY